MAESTRTAEEAAAACQTSVDRIVKSLVFQGRDTKKPYLLLVSGRNRVREALVAGEIGEKIIRPDADFVRQVTGYAIGGIPPFAHANMMLTFMDQDLLQHDTVYAAAGTPTSIFSISPQALHKLGNSRIIRVHDD
ncbi:MAG: YbaK/EbsC family protein [Rhizobiaceae bacterium]